MERDRLTTAVETKKNIYQDSPQKIKNIFRTALFLRLKMTSQYLHPYFTYLIKKKPLCLFFAVLLFVNLILNTDLA